MKAVVFDLDDTLLLDMPLVEGALARTAEVGAAHGLDPGELPGAARAAARAIWRGAAGYPQWFAMGIASWEGLAADFHGGHESMRVLEAWAPEYRARAWGDAARALGSDDPALAAELAETFKRERRARHELFEESLELLAALRQDGWMLGLLTNGPPDLQREKIRVVGIEDAFDAVVISGEEGVGKPDAAVFRIVLDRLGVEAADAVMVGDNPKRDHHGGRSVGMRTVLVNRWGYDPVPEFGDPDASMTDLYGFREVVGAWR